MSISYFDQFTTSIFGIEYETYDRDWALNSSCYLSCAPPKSFLSKKDIYWIYRSKNQYWCANAPLIVFDSTHYGFLWISSVIWLSIAKNNHDKIGRRICAQACGQTAYEADIRHFWQKGRWCEWGRAPRLRIRQPWRSSLIQWRRRGRWDSSRSNVWQRADEIPPKMVYRPYQAPLRS